MTVAKSEESPNKATTERFLERKNLYFRARSGVAGELERAVLHYGDSAPLTWLWPNRIPQGRVTLIEGPGGSGKSLVALDLAARLSADRPWPDGTPQPHPGSRAVIVCRQDHHADVVAARLEKMGADPRRFVQFHELEHGQRAGDGSSRLQESRPLEFPTDLQTLDRILTLDSQIKLVVIDPLSDFCGSKKLLAETIHRLNRLANEKQIAIVITLRANARFNRQGDLVVKSKHDTEAARCQWCCLADPEDPARRLFVPTLMNYARLPRGQAFQPGEMNFDWLPGEVDLHDPLRNISPSARWLKEALKGGPIPAEELKKRGKQLGFSEGQLQRAVYEVGGMKERDNNYRKGSKSMWSLEEQLATAVEDELRAMAAAGHPMTTTEVSENPPLPLGEGRGEGMCPIDPRQENQVPAVQQPAERPRENERESNDRPHPNPLPEGEGKRLVASESGGDVAAAPVTPVAPAPSVAPVRPARPLSEPVYIPWDDSPSSRLNPLNEMLDAPTNPNQLRRNVKSVKSNEEMRGSECGIRNDAQTKSTEH